MKEVIRTFGWTIRILEDEPARHWHFAVRRLRKVLTITHFSLRNHLTSITRLQALVLLSVTALIQARSRLFQLPRRG